MALENLTIRPEIDSDREAVFQVNTAAFGREIEAHLVEDLRGSGSTLISLVAEMHKRIVGHILFTTIRLTAEKPGPKGAALGPVGVSPKYQSMGIGSGLIRMGLTDLQTSGIDYCVVLGHSKYYPRFGFKQAASFGLECQWDVPDPVFMAMELRPGALAGISGLVRYHPAFDRAT